MTCTNCVRRVTSATGGDANFQIYIGIDPCAQHATLTAQPPTQAAPSVFSQAVASLLVDEQGFNTLLARLQNPTLEDCCSHGKTILARSSTRQKLAELFRAGMCLRPMRG